MEEGTTERVNQKHEIGPDRSFLKDLHRWERVEPGVRETRVRKQTQLPDRGEGGGRPDSDRGDAGDDRDRPIVASNQSEKAPI